MKPFILTWRPSFTLKTNERFIDGIISFAHASVNVTDFSVVNVHVDELSSARIWQYKLCATFSANVNKNYHLPIKVYYRICTIRHIRIDKSCKPECALSFNMSWQILVNFIHQPMLKLKTHSTNIRPSMLKLKAHSGFHDLFLK